MIIIFGDALARARMIASTLFGFSYMRRQVSDDHNAPNGYLAELRTIKTEESVTVVEGHYQPLDHNFFQDNQSTMDLDLIDNTSTMPLSVFLPIGVMLLFAALILLVIMFRRHPAAVMTVAAASLLAAGAYNLLILLQSSSNRSAFDPQAPPKYE